MTELLYMNGFNIETCEASVLEVQSTEDGRIDIVLDQTCFYARGGGQDWDMGEIQSSKGKLAVEEVRLDENGSVHHIGILEGEIVSGDSAECQVDHERRQVNTRLHSAGHVIDMAIDALSLDWVATKGQHYPHLSAIEYEGTWNPEQVEELRSNIEQQARAFVEAGSTNHVKFMTPDEMKAICKHVPENLPTNKPSRIVLYNDFGIPCGGTHVADIHEVGIITISKIKQKKGVIRVNYEVEGIN